MARVAPLTGADRARGGKPVEMRRVVDGIRWARWRDLPAVYGKSTTCWRWYSRWSEDGAWAKIYAVLATPLATSAPRTVGESKRR